MTIDLGALPPEVSSILIYSGPGSTPLVSAASAWNALAAELSSAAIGYENVVTQLTGEEWLGPASASAADAVSPYIEWVTNTSAQAEQAASQAGSAAAAFETVLASVVPPEVVLTNRAELTQLLSTNVLGQNSSAISSLEAEYSQFWAQNSSSLYGYAASSASATQLPKFSAAPAVANPAAAATQSTAAATSVSSIQQQLNTLISQLYKQLNALVAPLYAPFQVEQNYLTSSAGPLSWMWQALFGASTFPSSIFALLTDYSPYASFFYYTEGLPNFSIGIANFLTQTAKTTGALGGAAASAAAAVPKGLPALGGMLGGGAAHVAGSLGTAPSVGRLSVPVGWNTALPGAHAGPTAIPVSNIREAPDAGAGNLLGGMPLAGAGAGGHAGSGPRYGFRPTVMSRPPSAG